MSETDCPDTPILLSILEESAVGNNAEDVLRHLDTCIACQRTLETLAGDPSLWEAAAQGLGKSARHEPALRHAVERLKNDEFPVIEDGDLSFLKPTDKAGLLGLFGPYEIQEQIGRGGMGIVLKGLDPDLNRVVAIKVLSPYLASNPVARRRFVREARAAAAVCHDHIVSVHSVSEADGLPYLVMQYVAGESLQSRLDRVGPLELIDTVHIGLQTAAGLAAAHAQGLIHRDIKPSNLLLENGLSRVKITDFGLARMADDVKLTQNGVVAGTPEYMAPEQARAESVDHRSDLFSLGGVLYAMCTGMPPFQGSNAVAIIRQVSDLTPRPVREINAAVPAWLEALVTRLLAKAPADRFQSADEVAALLEGYLAHLRQPATVAAPELPLSRPATIVAKAAIEPQMNTRKWRLALVGLIGMVAILSIFAVRNLFYRQVPIGGGTGGASALAVDDFQAVTPKNGAVCLVVNKNSGRCLSNNGLTEPGSKIVQGPTPDQAGESEHWQLVETGNGFRFRNEASKLFLEIGSANSRAGVQAIQWRDQSAAVHQRWKIEQAEDGVVLRAMHSQLVLSIGEGSPEPGGRAVQWTYLPNVREELWELRPVTSLAGSRSPQVQYLEELVWKFDGDSSHRQSLELDGPDADECVQFEPGGLRIALPTGHRDKRMGTGLAAKVPIKGDFEVTASFEMLKEPAPSDAGLGTGIYLWVEANTPDINRATVTRGVWGMRRYYTWLHLSDEETGKPNTEDLKFFPAIAKSGKLRITRAGSAVSFYIAEAPGDDFTLLYRHPFVADDLKAIHIGGSTGGPKASLEGRITELRVRAGNLPISPKAATNPAADKGWLSRALALGLVVTLAVALGVWVFARIRPRVAAKTEHSSVPGKEAAATPVSFPCSGCGRSLRCRSALAGKSGKCPHCGTGVIVPAATAAVAGIPEKQSTPRKWWIFSSIVLFLALVLAGVRLLRHSPKPHEMANVNLVNNLASEVSEAGIYEQEYDPDGRAFRWTDGHAKLVIPIDDKRPPHSVFVKLLVLRPPLVKQVPLEIVVNSQPLFKDRIATGEWERTFELRGNNLRSAVTVEIISDNFHPEGVMDDGANDDTRTLGIQVRDVKLLSPAVEGATAPPETHLDGWSVVGMVLCLLSLTSGAWLYRRRQSCAAQRFSVPAIDGRVKPEFAPATASIQRPG